MGEGEINTVAHSGHAEQISRLGDALNEANRWSRSPGTGGEDDDTLVDWGLFWSRASSVLLHGVVAELGDVERERGSGCGHGERRRCAPFGRPWEREQRGGERLRAREREVRGLWASPGTRERQEVASRSWSLRPARALSRGDSSSFGARGGRRQEEPLVGWVGFAQCWAGWWAAQVRPGTISFLSFISVFYFFYSVLN